MPKEFEALNLYKLSFRQPVKFPNFSPRTIKALGGTYLVWGLSGSDEYNLFVYVFSESDESQFSRRSVNAGTTQKTVGITLIVLAILTVLGVGLSILLFKNVNEVFGAGGLGITFALGIGISGFLIFRKLT